MGKIAKGEVFGFTEILRKSKLRMNKIVALEDTFMLHLSAENFNEIFNTENIQQIVRASKIKSPQQAIKDIIAFHKWNKIRKDASVTAAMNREEKPQSSLDFIKRIHQIQDSITKMSDPEIIKKLNSGKDLKVIKIKKSYKQVDDPHYLKLNSLDEISKRTVRFALPDSYFDDGFK